MPRRAAVVLLAALVVACGAAAAQERVRPTFGKDRRGDVRGPLDVVRVALGRTASGGLRGEITMAAGWDADALRAGSAPGALCLRLHSRRAPDAEPPDHLVCATAAAEGERLVGRVLRDRANGLPRTVARASVSRPTDRTIYLRFRRGNIGDPARVRFSGESVTRGERCPAPLGCRDLAPDAPATMELRLRSRSDNR